MSVRERDSQRRRQKAGRSESGLVDVTLTKNREGHVGVSGKPDTQTSLAPPPALFATISLLMTSQSLPLTILPCTSESLILMFPTDIICVIMCRID